jgi:hypothetical protein
VGGGAACALSGKFDVLVPQRLSDIGAPRTASHHSERSDPYGPKSAEFATKRYMQQGSGDGREERWIYLKMESPVITLVWGGLASVPGGQSSVAATVV